MPKNELCCTKIIVIMEDDHGAERTTTRFGFCGENHRDAEVANARCHNMNSSTDKPVFISKIADGDEYMDRFRSADGVFYCCRCRLTYTVAIRSPVDGQGMHMCSNTRMHTSCPECIASAEYEDIPVPLFTRSVRFAGGDKGVPSVPGAMYSCKSATLSTISLTTTASTTDDASAASSTSLIRDAKGAPTDARQTGRGAYKKRIVGAFSRMLDELELIDEEFENKTVDIDADPSSADAQAERDEFLTKMSGALSDSTVSHSPPSSSSSSSTRRQRASRTRCSSASRPATRRGLL